MLDHSSSQEMAEKDSRHARACGPCHSDAACINGCTPGSDRRAKRVLKDVTGYKNPEVILRIMDKVPCTQEHAEALFEEMKQYLSRSAVSKKRSSPTKEVDVAWHEFILFTRDYAEFCHVHFGRFMHHVPRLASWTPRARPTAVVAVAKVNATLSSQERRRGSRSWRVAARTARHCPTVTRVRSATASRREVRIKRRMVPRTRGPYVALVLVNQAIFIL